MKPWPAQAVQNIQKLKFAVCNIGPELFVGEEFGSPRDNYVGSKATNSLGLHNLKYRQLLISPPSKIPTRRKRTLSKNQSQELVCYRRKSSEDALNNKSQEASQLPALDAPERSKKSPVRIYRQSVDMKGSDSGPTSRRISIVNVISLNEQAGVKKNFLDELEFTEDVQQKFTKKYNHFKRTQNRAQARRLGRFKSLAEIENRASVLNMHSEIIQSPVEKDVAENERSGIQNEAEGAIKKKKHPFVGKINMSKCLTDRDESKTKPKEQEKEKNKEENLQQYSITDNLKTQIAATLPTQEALVCISNVENKNIRNSSFSYSNTYREVQQIKSSRVHQVKLPKLKGLVKKKSSGHFLDNQLFSIGRSIVSSLADFEDEKKRSSHRAKIHNSSQGDLRAEDRRPRKSHSLNVSLLIEDKANKSRNESLFQVEPQEKTLLKQKRVTKCKPLTFEAVKQTKVDEPTNIINTSTVLGKPPVAKKPSLQITTTKNEKFAQQKRSKSIAKIKNNITEELVNTKLEGWVQTAELKKRHKPKTSIHIFDE